jgi:GH15 family glucan-1,4-alpha-glucosidase
MFEMAGRESSHHATDLALLTLVWPLGDDLPICRNDQRLIVERVERELAGSRGVVRYADDTYNVCHGGPPEWTMGFGFLALAWNALGESDKAMWYLRRLESLATPQGELPEAWCRESTCDRYFNSPLCWSHALHVVARVELGLESTESAQAHLRRLRKAG